MYNEPKKWKCFATKLRYILFIQGGSIGNETFLADFEKEETVFPDIEISHATEYFQHLVT